MFSAGLAVKLRNDCSCIVTHASQSEQNDVKIRHCHSIFYCHATASHIICCSTRKFSSGREVASGWSAFFFYRKHSSFFSWGFSVVWCESLHATILSVDLFRTVCCTVFCWAIKCLELGFPLCTILRWKKKGNIPRRKASNTSLPNLPANFFTACSSLCFYTVIMSNCHTKYEWKNGTIICITASVGFLHVVCCKCVSARAQELVAQSCNLHLVGNAQL